MGGHQQATICHPKTKQHRDPDQATALLIAVIKDHEDRHHPQTAVIQDCPSANSWNQRVSNETAPRRLSRNLSMSSVVIRYDPAPCMIIGCDGTQCHRVVTLSIVVSITVPIAVSIGVEIEQSRGVGNVSVCSMSLVHFVPLYTHRNWLEIVDVHIVMTCRCSV